MATTGWPAASAEAPRPLGAEARPPWGSSRGDHGTYGARWRTCVMGLGSRAGGPSSDFYVIINPRSQFTDRLHSILASVTL